MIGPGSSANVNADFRPIGLYECRQHHLASLVLCKCNNALFTNHVHAFSANILTDYLGTPEVKQVRLSLNQTYGELGLHNHTPLVNSTVIHECMCS